MRYKMRVTIAGLFLCVPDEELKVVHVLFPKGPVSPGGGGHAHGTHPMPAHDLMLVFEEARGLAPISLNDRDLDLSALSREATLPGFPAELFALTDQATGVAACDLSVARSEYADTYLMGRMTLRGGTLVKVRDSAFKFSDGSVRPLAGIIEWIADLPGEGFPGASLPTLTRGAPASVPPLAPMPENFVSGAVRMGIVHAPERYRVRTLEELLNPPASYDAEHLEMLYALVPSVTNPVIPTPHGPVNMSYPTRCVGARSK